MSFVGHTSDDPAEVDDEPFDAELEDILEDLELQDAEEEEQARREEAEAQSIAEELRRAREQHTARQGPRVVLTPVDGRRVSNDEQARFDNILRQITGHGDHRTETAVTTEVEDTATEWNRITNRAVRPRRATDRNLWPDLATMIRTSEPEPDLSSSLRMISAINLVENEWGVIELNTRMGESIEVHMARKIVETCGKVRVPEGIPVVDIQFDREMMSDIRMDSLEETIKQGPDGIYYVTQPAYFVHVGDIVTKFDVLADAFTSFSALTGQSNPPVFYPVTEMEEQDWEGTDADEIPSYVNSEHVTATHELMAGIPEPDPGF
jgi:hypothetical protein